MVNVSANFHTLAIQDAPTTRVRIYFIGDGVDCTDDNSVQTNGTLLKWAVGDTDSNRRIAQDGIKFTEFFNPDVNIQIGRAVSSQIEMTLVNTDGGLNNFTYGRCKVYLDVYDSANSAWLSCPMGVYIIELPTKRKSQLIHAFGYDQMQKLDGICDTWWSGLNWSGGLTLLQIIQSMASQLGISVSANTASNILNSSVTYTEAPFDCVEVTYREVLETIAEATGTVARFDRNGALLLRWFEMPKINNQSILIDTDTVGNQCLNIDVGEYTVSNIDSLLVKIAKSDIGVVVGSGTNQYVILGNLLLGEDAATITARATQIYNRLIDWVDPDIGATVYSPTTAKLIWDWSIESGDTVKIRNNGQIRYLPTFQQTMTWRGGYVISDLMNSGDPVRPVSDATDRDYYRLDSNMRSMTISADRINLLGYTTINNGFKVNLDGTFEANGATLNGSLESNGYTRLNQYPVKTSISNGDITTVLDLNGTDKTIFSVANADNSPGEYWATIGITGEMDGNGTSSTRFQPGTGTFRGYDHYAHISRLGMNFVPSSYEANTPSWDLARSAATFNIPVTVTDDVTASTFNSFLKIERTTIANGASGSINMPNSSSAFLLVSGIRDASKFIASVRANSAGDVSHVEFGTPGATFSVSTNTLTIANSSNGEMQILIFRF